MFGQPLLVRQMQSEGGAAGALHGACTEGALATTFTSSQGLLLMLPNMYKIAGELLPCVIHIAARTIATHALSIFGDHSDVYATRSCGFAFLCSSSVQESAHMAIASHVATLKASVPFGHFFDGFRTTHEIQKIKMPTPDQMRQCVDMEAINRFRNRALNPEAPVLRGSAQNPDIFFQAAEASNKFFWAVPEILEQVFATIQAVFGVSYKLFEYFGSPTATHVVICMGSGSEVCKTTAELLVSQGKQVGLLKVRLYRPFSVKHFIAALPKTVKCISVLDRGKDPMGHGEPLYLDVCAALQEAGISGVTVTGGRYGLSSKDFNPDMALAVFKNLLSAAPKNHFTVGIIDDLTNTSLSVTEHIDVIPTGTRQCLLWGIGGDGTVGANKNAIKLIANNTGLHAQGYFAYDANKAGGLTVSHLRFGPTPFEAPYFISDSDYVACHKTNYISRFNLLRTLKQGGTFVLNCPWRSVSELDQFLPARLRKAIALKRAKFYTIDGTRIAKEAQMGPFVNNVLQAVFFFLSGVLEVDVAINLLKTSVKKMYKRKGPEVIQKNINAIDMSLHPDALVAVAYPDSWAALAEDSPTVEGLMAPSDPRHTAFYNDIMAPIGRFEGDEVPVSKIPPGGELPVGTSQFIKRGVASNVPHWNLDTCVQCNRCSFVCPHAVIRSYWLNEEESRNAPASLQTKKANKPGHQFRIQVSALDCTGCALCAETCPVKCLEMTPLEIEYPKNKENIEYVRKSVKAKPELGDRKTAVGVGAQQPLLEFPGSCAGCGETPYIRLISQMFGERMCVAAATGCNTIWGGSFPLVPYTTNAMGEGPAWANSLFEDGAEFGFGIACGYKQRRLKFISVVRSVVEDKAEVVGMTPELKGLMSEWLPVCMDFAQSRALRDKLRPVLARIDTSATNLDSRLRELLLPANMKMWARTSFWVFGGDGFAYDIGFGGLDHVIANNEDINIFIMDTEVYSNTGGQRSKATQIGAQAKFAMGGKDTPKKDLGMIAMSYQSVYVASVAMGADNQQTMNALREAESYNGPSLVIAYCPCTEHNIIAGMKECMKVQKLAVDTGYWINYRFNPMLTEEHKNPFTLDSPEPKRDPHDYMATQGRFVALERDSPDTARVLQGILIENLKKRYQHYKRLIKLYEPDEVPAATVAPTKGNVLHILFASETGNSEAAANLVNSKAGAAGLPTKIGAIDSVDFTKIFQEGSTIALFLSSNANGIPANGAKFLDWLTTTKSPLSNVHLAFFGLGDSSFPTFQWVPNKVYTRLQELGVQFFHERGYGDENKGGYKVTLDTWYPEMLSKAAVLLKGAPSQAPATQPTPSPAVTTPVTAPATTAAAPTTTTTPTKVVAVPTVTPIPAPAMSPSEMEAACRAATAAAEANSTTYIKVAPNVYWVGAVDYDERDFHGIDIQRGTSYNAYLILGATPTLVDTVKAPFTGALLANIEALIDPRLIRYVVVNHAENDHSSALGQVMQVCPNAQIICNSKCHDALKKIYRIPGFRSATYNLAAITNHNTASADASTWRVQIIKEGDTLSLGPQQTLWFMDTPFVHWPESMFSYLVEERVLFTSDAFGQHVACAERFDDQLLNEPASGSTRATNGVPTTQDLMEVARSYYANILMPFGKTINTALEKLLRLLPAVDAKNPNFNASTEKSPLPRVLATAHGIAWRRDPMLIVSMYKQWAAHTVSPKVVIIYDTMYGSTEKMARAIFQGVMETKAVDSKKVTAMLLNVRSNHPTVIANEVLDSACIAWGTCALNNEPLPTVARAFTYIKGLKPTGRSGVTFGSYGWSPSTINNLGKVALETGIEQVVPPIACQFTPDDKVLQTCYDAGHKLAEAALKKVA
ncbi:pyruvate NADP oxidoreductase [Pelomyxa schiedti]|nr:pyruvate NADP oxidoreductase [Pelomyxa schiedti]